MDYPEHPYIKTNFIHFLLSFLSTIPQIKGASFIRLAVSSQATTEILNIIKEQYVQTFVF